MGGRGRWGRRTTRRLEFNDTQLILTAVETVITHKPHERPLPPTDDLTYKGYELIASCWDGEKTPFYPMLPTDRAWSLVAR